MVVGEWRKGRKRVEKEERREERREPTASVSLRTTPMEPLAHLTVRKERKERVRKRARVR